MARRMRAVGFFPFFDNLAETTRMVRIATALRALGGRPVMFSHGGNYERLAHEQDLPVHRVAPTYSRSEIDRLMRMDRLEQFGDPFSAESLREHVRTESAAYAEEQVSVVVTGFNLPSSLSARYARLPLVWILAGTSFPPYFAARYATLPDTFDNAFVQLLPSALRRWLTSVVALRISRGTGAFNTVARELGLPRFPTVLSLWSGDVDLVSDLPQMLALPPELDYPPESYIGPLLGHLDLPLAPDVEEHLRRPGRHIYFAMGSSGEKQLYLRVLRALAGTGHNVIAACTTIVAPEELPPLGANVLVQQFVPALEVNRRVDLAVTHGGQGTVYTAAYAGRPVIGIPMQFEQQYNIDGLVRHGAAIRLSKKRFRERHLLEAVTEVFGDYERHAHRAEALASSLPFVDGAESGARRLLEIAQAHASQE